MINKVSSFKQQKFVLIVFKARSPTLRCQHDPSEAEEAFLPSLSFWWLLALLHIPCLTTTSAHLHMAIYSVAGCVFTP